MDRTLAEEDETPSLLSNGVPGMAILTADGKRLSARTMPSTA